MWARPTGVEVAGRREIWVPDQTSEGRHGWDICSEPDVFDHKMVAFKYRVDDNEHHWLGKVIHAPKGESLDDKDDSGVSFRDQMHLVLTGLVEQLTKGFVFQDSDEMQGRTFIDQWPEIEHCEERWNRFVRYVPPKRDSPQVVDEL